MEYRHLWQDNCSSCYQKSIQKIHRTIHPFVEKIEVGQTPWKSTVKIEKETKQSILSIDKQLIISKSLGKEGEKYIEELYNVEQDLQNDGLLTKRPHCSKTSQLEFYSGNFDLID